MMTRTFQKKLSICFRFQILLLVWAIFAGEAAGLFAQPLAGPPDFGAENDPQSLKTLAYRNLTLERRTRAQLLETEALLNQGEYLQATSLLDRLLAIEEDFMLSLNDGDELVSARTAAEQLLESGGPKFWQAYEGLRGQQAMQFFELARQNQNPQQLRMIIQRFPGTLGGFQATKMLAMLHWDQGDNALAAAIWEHLIDSPYHQQRLTAQHRLLAALAARAGGRTDLSNRWLAAVRTQPLKLNQETKSVEQWFNRFRETSPNLKTTVATAVEMTGVPASTNPQQYPSLTPPLTTPLWKHSLAENVDVPLRLVLEELLGNTDFLGIRPTISQSNLDNAENLSGSMKIKTALTSSQVLTVGNQLVVRTLDGLEAFELNTGKSLWKHACDPDMTKLWRVLWEEAQRRTQGQRSSVNTRREMVRVMQNTLFENGVVNTLSTDGLRIYAMEQVAFPQVAFSFRFRTVGRQQTGNDYDKLTNRLVALELQPNGRPKVAWRVGKPIADSENERPANQELEKYAFLGAPLPAMGMLFLMGEYDGTLSMLALDPDSGKLLWKQPVCSLERDYRLSRDAIRVTPLAHSSGMVFCATPLGTMVAVDAVTGTLRWTQSLIDGSDFLPRFYPGGYLRENLGPEGLTDRILIHGSRIFMLPKSSTLISCLDLKTGKLLWNSERIRGGDSGDISLGGVVGQILLVVGDGQCRGLDLNSGEERWFLNTPAISGRGILSGKYFYLPLATGGTFTCDVERGRQHGIFNLNEEPSQGNAAVGENSQTEAPPRLSNLFATENQIVSVSPVGIAVYPQTGTVIRQRRTEVAGQPSAKTLLQLAELELRIGELSSARSSLRHSLQLAGEPKVREQAETLLRALLYRQLADLQHVRQWNEMPPVLAELKTLSAHNATLNTRYLMTLATLEAEQNHLGEVLRLTNQLQQSQQAGYFSPLGSEHAAIVSVSSWKLALIRQTLQNVPEAELPKLHRILDDHFQALRNSGNLSELMEFLKTFPHWPGTDRLPLELAARFLQMGKYQQAEFWYLRANNHPEKSLQAEARLGLMQLYRQANFDHDAAKIAENLLANYADVLISSNGHAEGIPVREAVAEFVNTHPQLARTLDLRKPIPLPYATRRISVEQEMSWPSDQELWKIFGPETSTVNTDHEAHFLLREQRGSRGEKQLMLIDRDTAAVQGQLPLPTYRIFAPSYHHSRTGHFLPMGSNGSVLGVSQLQVADEESLWETRVTNSSAFAQTTLRPGPSGPNFCTFQRNGFLCALDPATGKLLWKRTDLEARSGFDADYYAGVYGDEHVLVVMGPEQQIYKLIDTMTGKILRRGRVPIDYRHTRRTSGRFLLYVSAGTNEKEIRLWDPLTDEVLFSHPLVGNFRCVNTDEDTFALLLGKNQLVYLEPSTGKILHRVTVDPAALNAASAITMFQDDVHDYFCLTSPRPFQAANPGAKTILESYESGTMIPSVHMQGYMIAVDRKTYTVKWSRYTHPRTMLQIPHLKLPVLIGLCRTRAGNEQHTKVEITDRETGEVLTEVGDLKYDRLLHVEFDHTTAVITLRGVLTKIRIDLSSGKILDERPL